LATLDELKLELMKRKEAVKVGWANIRHIYNTRGSALQISANHVFKKKFQKKFQKISKTNFKKFQKKNSIFFWKLKKLVRLNSYACHRGTACEIFGSLGPLV
jgi:hypothetical protein